MNAEEGFMITFFTETRGRITEHGYSLHRIWITRFAKTSVFRFQN